MVEFDGSLLNEVLSALGGHLEAAGESAAIVVVGGSTLAVRGWVNRVTADVDVIAQATRQDGDRVLVAADPLPSALVVAAERVARDYGLPSWWLDTNIGLQWNHGLPPEFSEEIEWRRYGSLEVGFAGRRSLIALKLYAAADGGPESIHVQDLIALNPTDEELSKAVDWVSRQDASHHFPALVEEVRTHVDRALGRAGPTR